ncbi:MAG: hypothetical protein HBSAPP03_28080 [Phycisphaerae bacterium]|nr:MAG: hypothetical protein HBSAPP03_28080 [Phycisphaerae bacterium]
MPEHDPIAQHLDTWGRATPQPPPVPRHFVSRLRTRRLHRMLPIAGAGSALVLTFAVAIWITHHASPGHDLRPWQPERPIVRAPEPELPLVPVRWGPAKSLRAGSCRDPACVDAWLAGV